MFRLIVTGYNRLKALFSPPPANSSHQEKPGDWKTLLSKAISQIKNWFFLRPRALKILLSVKTWLVLGLGASNFFVLSLVFNTYLQTGGISMYSTSASESLVRRECQDAVEKVQQGRDSQLCWLELDKRHRGAKYTQKIKFKISKSVAGKLVIETKEVKLKDRTKHAEKLEADFCGDCEKNEDLDQTTALMDVMKQIVDMAETQEEGVKDALNTAREEYERDQIDKREARVKHRRCEGYWDEDAEEYEEYDTEGRLDCKMAKLVRMNPREKDFYYQNVLRDEFWKIAVDEEEDPYLIADHLNRIRLNTQFSYSSRNSAGLIGNYVRWRDKYTDLEDDYHRNFMLDQIVESASGLASHLGEQGRRDLLYLRSGLDRNFDMAGSRLNSIIDRMPHPASYTPAGHTSPAGRSSIQTLDLY